MQYDARVLRVLPLRFLYVLPIRRWITSVSAGPLAKSGIDSAADWRGGQLRGE